MKTILFCDTETSGKADFKQPPSAKHQPRIVQLAAILTDDTGKELMSMNAIINPDGFDIPTEASAIHGITTELAREIGIPIRCAMNMFEHMARSVDVVVAHNSDFDSFMVEIEFLRAFEESFERDWVCTMKAMTDICQLPGPYGFKWPKLQEAHKHCFGEEFDGAHDALADVRAAARIYFWLEKRNMPPVMVDESPVFNL